MIPTRRRVVFLYVRGSDCWYRDEFNGGVEEDVLRLEGGQEEIDGGLNQTYNDGRTILHAKLVSKTTVYKLDTRQSTQYTRTNWTMSAEIKFTTTKEEKQWNSPNLNATSYWKTLGWFELFELLCSNATTSAYMDNLVPKRGRESESTPGWSNLFKSNSNQIIDAKFSINDARLQYTQGYMEASPESPILMTSSQTIVK